nr:hypothetical protein [uncultured Desulfobacter sp.]
MNYTTKLAGVLAAMLMLAIAMSPIHSLAQDLRGDTPYLVLKADKVQLQIDGKMAKDNPTLNTELVYRLDYSNSGMEAELMSFGFVTKGFKSKVGHTGNISVRFIPERTKTSYNQKLNQIMTKFEAEIHYPLIDKIVGFQEPDENKVEQDNFRPFTETASGVIVCSLDRQPNLRNKEKQGLRSTIDMTTKIEDRVVGAIEYVELNKAELVGTIVWPLYFRKTINVQPVFVGYTPDTGCSLGGSGVSTGGSWETAKEYAFDIWYRCCLRLRFLPPVYVSNDDWRILSPTEAGALRASYDDPNAIEIFFTENFDPIGKWGGGATWGSGTANAQIVTCDANLPINLYNVAHELGHGLGLKHPSQWPYNTTPGSLMEPSGFCLDNPELMSQKNCDNISNPLIYWSLSISNCSQTPNM